MVGDKCDNAFGGKDKLIASVPINVNEIIKYGEVSGWFQLRQKLNVLANSIANNNDDETSHGRISLKVIYKPKFEIAYRKGDG